MSKRPLCNACRKRPCDMSQLRSSGHHICARCRNLYNAQWRKKKWDAGARVMCKYHPNSLVTPALWIHTGKRLCSRCWNNRPNVRACKHRRKVSPTVREHEKWLRRSFRTRDRIRENAL